MTNNLKTSYEKIIELMVMKNITKDQLIKDLHISEQRFIARSQGLPLTNDEISKVSQYLDVAPNYLEPTINTTSANNSEKIMDSVDEMYHENYIDSKTKPKSIISKIFTSDSDTQNGRSTISSLIFEVVVIIFAVAICFWVGFSSPFGSMLNNPFLIIWFAILGIIIISLVIDIIRKILKALK